MGLQRESVSCLAGAWLVLPLGPGLGLFLSEGFQEETLGLSSC